MIQLPDLFSFGWEQPEGNWVFLTFNMPAHFTGELSVSPRKLAISPNIYKTPSYTQCGLILTGPTRFLAVPPGLHRTEWTSACITHSRLGKVWLSGTPHPHTHWRGDRARPSRWKRYYCYKQLSFLGREKELRLVRGLAMPWCYVEVADIVPMSGKGV